MDTQDDGQEGTLWRCWVGDPDELCLGSPGRLGAFSPRFSSGFAHEVTASPGLGRRWADDGVEMGRRMPWRFPGA